MLGVNGAFIPPILAAYASFVLGQEAFTKRQAVEQAMLGA